MLIADIHHVSLMVADTERALRFYRDVLGMAVLPRPAIRVAGAWLDAGNGRQLHLVEGDRPAPCGQHVAFLVDDLDRAIATLEQAGVAVTTPKQVGDTPIRQAFLADPDGNLLELSRP